MKKIILIFLIISSVNLSVKAETTYLAGIDEAIDLALKNSGELRAAQARFGMAEARVFTAGAVLNPVLISDNGTAEKTYRLGIQCFLETAGKRKKRLSEAQLQRQIAQEETNIKILDIKTSIRKSYIEFYTLQQKEKALNDIINTIDVLHEMSNKKFKSGTITQLDLIQIEMIKINAEVELENANAEITQAYNSLNLLLGNGLQKNCVLGTPNLDNKFKNITKLTDEEYNLSLEKLEEIAFKNRPELRLCSNNIELAKKQIDIAETNRIPNILLAAGPDWVYNNPPAVNVGAFIMAAVEIPILNRQQGPIKEAVAKQQYSEKQYEYQKDMILYEIKDAYTRLVTNTRLIEKYQNELLPRAENIVNSSIKNFENNQGGVVTPIMAQDTSLKVKFAYFKIISNYQNAINDLERALGLPL